MFHVNPLHKKRADFHRGAFRQAVGNFFNIVVIIYSIKSFDRHQLALFGHGVLNSSSVWLVTLLTTFCVHRYSVTKCSLPEICSLQDFRLLQL